MHCQRHIKRFLTHYGKTYWKHTWSNEGTCRVPDGIRKAEPE